MKKGILNIFNFALCAIWDSFNSIIHDIRLLNAANKSINATQGPHGPASP